MRWPLRRRSTSVPSWPLGAGGGTIVCSGVTLPIRGITLCQGQTILSAAYSGPAPELDGPVTVRGGDGSVIASGSWMRNRPLRVGETGYAEVCIRYLGIAGDDWVARPTVLGP